MTSASVSSSPRSYRSVLVFCALSLLSMVLALVVERISNPSLIVRGSSPMAAMPPAMQEEVMPKGAAMPGMPEMSEIGALMQMVRSNPNDVELKNKLTEALMNENQWDAAENFAKRARAQDPNNAKSAFLLGILYHRKGDSAQAAKELTHSLSLTEDENTRFSLALLYLYFLNEREQGLRLLKEGLDQTKLSPGMKKSFEEEMTKQMAPNTSNPPAKKD